MFELFKKTKKKTPISKFEFKKKFFKDPNHQWMNENKTVQRSIEILIDSLSPGHLEFFQKHQTFLVPCQAHLSCAIGKTQDHHLILVFPELMQMLKSASSFHAIAILAHELGHVYHQHTENKIDTLTAQIEADQFATDLGFGEELQEVLLDHSDDVDCKVRIAKITATLVTQRYSKSK